MIFSRLCGHVVVVEYFSLLMRRRMLKTDRQDPFSPQTKKKNPNGSSELATNGSLRAKTQKIPNPGKTR
jgi:hypothetical protein